MIYAGDEDNPDEITSGPEPEETPLWVYGEAAGFFTRRLRKQIPDREGEE